MDTHIQLHILMYKAAERNKDSFLQIQALLHTHTRAHTHTHTRAHTHAHTRTHTHAHTRTHTHTRTRTHTHAHAHTRTHTPWGDRESDESGLGELELAHFFMRGKHMERGIVGRGEEKHFYYLAQPLLAQSTHKHKAEALVNMKSTYTSVIHIR